MHEKVVSTNKYFDQDYGNFQAHLYTTSFYILSPNIKNNTRSFKNGKIILQIFMTNIQFVPQLTNTCHPFVQLNRVGKSRDHIETLILHADKLHDLNH